MFNSNNYNLNEKATKEFWNQIWIQKQSKCKKRAKQIRTYITNQFNNYFKKYFCKTRKEILEIGCANSYWLPIFAKEHKMKVAGIDYSQQGCRLARKILKKNKISGKIIHCNFFDPPKKLSKKFDIVISFGVVEHFKNTQATLKALKKFLKPDGLLITSIPNMNGLNGFIQRILNKPIFDIHQKITPADFIKFHKKIGMEILQSEYFMFINFGVLNLVSSYLSKQQKHPILYICLKNFQAILVRISLVIWFFETKCFNFPSNKITSPYIICVAKI